MGYFTKAKEKVKRFDREADEFGERVQNSKLGQGAKKAGTVIGQGVRRTGYELFDTGSRIYEDYRKAYPRTTTKKTPSLRNRGDNLSSYILGREEYKRRKGRRSVI